MKIILEESITSSIKTGVGQHTDVLNKLIKQYGCDYEIISNKLVEKIKNATLKRIYFLIWLNTIFFIKLLFQPKDTIVIYTSFLPCIKLKKIQQIGIIHDICVIIFPHLLSTLNRLNNHILNYLIIRNADKILTVSNTVKNEIKKYYNIPEERLHTVYNSFSLNKDTIQNDNGILNKYNLNNDDKYIISSSSLNPNKNITCLIEAFELFNKKYPEYKLILTGGKKEILKQYLNSSDNPNIIFTGFVSSNDLIALYKHAMCYVFPSIYEGFGIPIIDAQVLGLPVICTDIPIFKEVGGDSVIYAQNNKEDFANKIEYLLDIQLRNNVIEKGYKNAMRFNNSQIFLQFKNLLTDEK